METVSDVESLVHNHIPLVQREVWLLMRRLPSHVDCEDLTSAGLIALVVCAQAYTAERGVPFATLARIRVRGALLDQLRRLDWASRSVRSQARRVNSAREELATTLGRTPTSAELAEVLGVAVARVDEAAQDVRRAAVVSLQGVAGEAADLLIRDRAPGPEELTLRREEIGYLRDAVEALPDRLRTVVVGCFFQERPMAEIAAELGVTESRVSHLRTQALALLRRGINAQLDPDLLPEPRSANGGCAARRKEAYYAEIASRGDLRSRLAATDAEANPVAGAA